MQVSSVVVDDNLKESMKHGTAEFPMTMYTDDFKLFKEGRITWHWHKEFQLSYVLSDAVRFSVDGKEIILNPGEGIIINANVLHHIMPHNENCRMISIMFDSSLISGGENSIIRTKYVNPVLNNKNIKYILLKGNTSWENEVLRYTKMIKEQFDKQDFLYELKIRNYLSDIWLILLNELGISNESTCMCTHDDKRVKESIEFIHQNYAEKITLDNIAKSANVSRSECCRSFKRVLKMTPFEYLMEYRILKSLQYLADSDESISNIAFLVGFSGISYYSKVFKDFMKCTPSEYRCKKNFK